MTAKAKFTIQKDPLKQQELNQCMSHKFQGESQLQQLSQNSKHIIMSQDEQKKNPQPSPGFFDIMADVKKRAVGVWIEKSVANVPRNICSMIIVRRFLCLKRIPVRCLHNSIIMHKCKV